MPRRLAGRPASALGIGGGMLALVLAVPPALSAQADEPLRLELREAGGVGIELGDVLAAGGIREALESGLPVRLEVITELWRDRFFDSQEGREAWQATLWFDPLGETYRIEIQDRPVGLAGSPEDALEIVRSGLRSALRPAGAGTFYYLARLRIETLSLSDLEELRRWLRGELGPAVGGDDIVGSAIGRGIRRLFVRALALPAIQFEARTDRFDWPQ